MKELSPFNKMKILSYYGDAKRLIRGEFVVPRMLSIWISQCCQLCCQFCHSAKYNKEVHQFIDTKKIFNLIDEVSELGVESIEFSGGGEPTLHPDFYEISEYIKTKGLKVGVLTNGVKILDYDRIAKIFSYVRISLDAINELDYNSIKNPSTSGTFYRVQENIRNLIIAKKDSERPRVGIKFLINKKNYNKVLEAIGLAIRLNGDYIQFKRVHSCDDEVTEEQAKIAQDSIDKYRDIEKISVIGGVLKDKLECPCFMAPIHAVIDSLGNIYVCCFFDENIDLKIGNVLDSKFVDVWGSKYHREVMDRIKISDCNKVDCRWKFYSNFMDKVLREDALDISFN